MASVGLDISDQSVKFAELIRGPGSISLGRFGEEPIPAGIVSQGRIVDPEKLKAILLILKKKYRFNFLRVALPEEQIYLFRLRVPEVDEKDLRNTIELSLEEHVPMPALDTIFDYKVLNRQGEDYDVQVVATSTEIVESYLDIFRSSSLAPLSFELEAQAVARSVVDFADTGTYLIVDFGRTRTGISIVTSGTVQFTSTVDVGGLTLNELIMKGFNISFDQADVLKREYGLRRNVPEHDLFSVVVNGISILRDEINRHFVYWHTHPDESGKPRPEITKILLCGGDANLIGLPDYLAMSMRVSVELANPWINIYKKSGEIPDITFARSLSYATALGLALGDFEYD